MSTYTISSEWTTESDSHGVVVQCADLRESNGHTWRDGAYRILVGGKPVRGKGGSVPFKGESAWSDAERLASDLRSKAMYAR